MDIGTIPDFILFLAASVSLKRKVHKYYTNANGANDVSGY